MKKIKGRIVPKDKNEPSWTKHSTAIQKVSLLEDAFLRNKNTFNQQHPVILS